MTDARAMIAIFAVLCILGAAWLWQSAFQFTIDAAPVGSMMLAASVAMAVSGVFLFGFYFGTFY